MTSGFWSTKERAKKYNVNRVGSLLGGHRWQTSLPLKFCLLHKRLVWHGNYAHVSLEFCIFGLKPRRNDSVKNLLGKAPVETIAQKVKRWIIRVIWSIDKYQLLSEPLLRAHESQVFDALWKKKMVISKKRSALWRRVNYSMPFFKLPISRRR